MSETKEAAHVYEARLHVACSLPINSYEQLTAIRHVIGYLKKQSAQVSEETDGGKFEGFTFSDANPPVFNGWWFSDDRKQWIVDRIMLLFFDIKFGSDETAVAPLVASIKDEIARLYRIESGQGEDEIWVIAHKVIRH